MCVILCECCLHIYGEYKTGEHARSRFQRHTHGARILSMESHTKPFLATAPSALNEMNFERIYRMLQNERDVCVCVCVVWFRSWMNANICLRNTGAAYGITGLRLLRQPNRTASKWACMQQLAYELLLDSYHSRISHAIFGLLSPCMCAYRAEPTFHSFKIPNLIIQYRLLGVCVSMFFISSTRQSHFGSRFRTSAPIYSFT